MGRKLPELERLDWAGSGPSLHQRTSVSYAYNKDFCCKLWNGRSWRFAAKPLLLDHLGEPMVVIDDHLEYCRIASLDNWHWVKTC